MFRTRFAPSAIGVLQAGSIRTAVFCWLDARHHGGKFILRVEGVDRECSTRENVDAILDGTSWFSLDAQEYQRQFSAAVEDFVKSQSIVESSAEHCLHKSEAR
jgi:glutamyl-tRNA synthetase